ncbi:hypothetical protein AAIB41_11525 [Brucella sp. BE17]|uniref:hypothetical protein n=1 Tax=Brucella sp. BE17 TaxID=3142977 RepID=UPI0031BAD73D
MFIRFATILLFAFSNCLMAQGGTHSPVPIGTDQDASALIDRLKSTGRIAQDSSLVPQLIAEFAEASEDTQFDTLAVLAFLARDREQPPTLSRDNWHSIMDFCFQILSKPAGRGLHLAARSVLLMGNDLEIAQRAKSLLNHEEGLVRYNGVKLIYGYGDHIHVADFADEITQAADDPDQHVSNAAKVLISRLGLEYTPGPVRANSASEPNAE